MDRVTMNDEERETTKNCGRYVEQRAAWTYRSLSVAILTG
jgi:hypothetical protein